MSTDSPHLSLVVPAYNEEQRLGPSLRSMADHLASEGTRAEILVVDDGSQDGTAEVARSFSPPAGIEVKLVAQERNRGKGAAVRRGAAESRGELVLLSDADLSTPIGEWRKLRQAMKPGYDVAIGSRGLAQSRIEKHQPLYREGMGKTFNLMVRILGLSRFRDTQCGFKLFNRRAAQAVLARLTLERFAFDVEALLMAERSGFRVVEVPVIWRDSRGSRVRPGVDAARMAWDLLGLKLRDLRGELAVTVGPAPADSPHSRGRA